MVQKKENNDDNASSDSNDDHRDSNGMKLLRSYSAFKGAVWLYQSLYMCSNKLHY